MTAAVKLARMTRLVVLSVAVSIPVLTVRGGACVIDAPEHKVRGNLVVEISYNGQPLQGIEIHLSQNSQKEPYLVAVTSTVSDAKGRAAITGLTPGKYLLVVKHAGIEGEPAELKVVPDDQEDKFVQDELKLSWPNRKVFKVHDITGVAVRTPFDYRKHSESPLEGAKLTLTDAIPAARLRESVVGADGRFGFSGLKPGLYILHIRQKDIPRAASEEQIEGDIFVEVVSDARDQQMPRLRLFMSDCGMGIWLNDNEVVF